MSDPADRPTLLFFRSIPQDLLNRPPLASSLQSFESCLLLVALQRYSDAFTACVFAIESGLKSAFGYSREDRRSLERLIDDSRNRSDALRAFSIESLNEMRRARNDFVHYGYTSKDEIRSARLLLQTSLPFLQATYSSLLGFTLDEALLPEFAQQVSLASRLYRDDPDAERSRPTSFLAGLSHLVRWSVKDSLSASWELHAADSADRCGDKFDVVQGRKRKAEAQLEPCWSFDCPVCGGIETFVCQLDDSELERRQLRILRGVCAECELVAPLDAPGLAHCLCQDQHSAQANAILKDYGID